MTKEDRLINNLPKLSEKQLLHVYDVIKEMVNKADSFESFAASINADEVHECPHCKSSHFIKYGHNGKVQKYKCKECGKLFNIRTKTITSYTKKDWSVWQQFIDCFISEKTLIKTSELCNRLKVEFYTEEIQKLGFMFLIVPLSLF